MKPLTVISRISRRIGFDFLKRLSEEYWIIFGYSQNKDSINHLESHHFSSSFSDEKSSTNDCLNP